MFILDDLTPFEIEISGLIKQFKKEPYVLNAEDLAGELVSILPEDFNNPAIIGSGGAMTFSLMKRFGYDKTPYLIGVKRRYAQHPGQKYQAIEFDVSGKVDSSRQVIDDVVASGATINQFGEKLKCASLVLSLQSRGKYRQKEGTTVKGLDQIYCGQGVNCKTGFPAIFSGRFLLQSGSDENYFSYLSKYLESPDDMREEIKKSCNPQIKLLYEDPIKFIETQGDYKK